MSSEGLEASPQLSKGDVIIEIKDLRKTFEAKLGIMASLRRGKVLIMAVDDVSLAVRKGEVFGLAGESGCGKTTVGRTMLRLAEPDSGQIIYMGKDITKGDTRYLRSKLQIVFQDPYESINPRLNVYDIVAEGLVINKELFRIKSDEEVMEMVKKALSLVQLSPPELFLYRFPHELSGGQRQRVAIARVLVLQPDFIVADEPVSMLDVSIRAEVLNVMTSLRDSLGLSFLFITHDLALAKHVTDRLAIMYLGIIVEQGRSEDVIDRPFHPYTQALIAAIPVPDPDGRKVKVFAGGEVPSATNIPSGCRFRTRCPYAKELCETTVPELRLIEDEHYVSCHYYEEALAVFTSRIRAPSFV